MGLLVQDQLDWRFGFVIAFVRADIASYFYLKYKVSHTK